MYLSFYGLKIKPFQDSTNPSFFWLGEMHKEALAVFKYGLLKMPGFLLLTGDIGTGKTTLINVLINSLADKFIVVKVPDPGLEEIDFMNYVADTLNFQKRFTSKDTFFIHFSHFLNEASTVGKKVLLVVDECQRLSSGLLEEIILLANIEKDQKKSLKVLLIGQNEFNEVAQKNNNRALDQLISINYAITPLNLQETGKFIKHRLKIAGAKKDIFSADAITKIYQLSSGIPRRINIISDHALLIGFANGTKTVNGDLVRGCVEDLHPRDFSKDRSIDSLEPFVGHELLSLPKRPPALRKKTAVTRAGKTFGTVILLTMPVFLITYFTDQTTYRDLIHYIKNNGIRLLSNLHETDRQSLTISSQPDLDKTSVKEIDGKNPDVMPRELVKEEPVVRSTEQGLTPENTRPVSEASSEGETEVELQAVTTPSRTNDALDPTDKDLVEKDPGNTQITLPLPDPQDAIHGDVIQNDQASSGSTGTLESAIRPGHAEALKKKDETVLDSAQPPASIPDGERDMTRVKDVPDIDGFDKDKQEAENLFNKQPGLKVNEKITEETIPAQRNDIPDTLERPGKSTESKEIWEDTQENVDPGGIIDWVLKNRAK